MAIGAVALSLGAQDFSGTQIALFVNVSYFDTVANFYQRDQIEVHFDADATPIQIGSAVATAVRDAGLSRWGLTIPNNDIIIFSTERG